MSGRRVCLLSFSAILDDPRVRRQGDALHAQGWSVSAVGYESTVSAPPPWEVLGITQRPVPSGGAARLAFITRLLSVRLGVADAMDVYWKLPAVQEMFHQAEAVEADVYVANDWWTLPIARRLAGRRGAVYAYDSHEHGLSQGAGRWRWRLLFPPFVRGVEGGAIGGAAFVSTVCDGIADLLKGDYGLRSRPLVIRSTPVFCEAPARDTGDEVRVLYHGLMRRGRALEILVSSLAGWPPSFSLTLRGPCTPAYQRHLEGIAHRTGVADRLCILPPVPMTELVASAQEYDVGIFCMPGTSPQARLVLPNKLFEYVMAGLAVCVSDLPEMARVVRDHGVGWLIAEPTPDAVAGVVSSLDRGSIDSARGAARQAARTLCWEVESRKFIDAMLAAPGAPDAAGGN